MWRKSEETKSTSESSMESKPLSNSSVQSVANASASSTASVTVNQGIIIKGEISGQGDLIVDGTFEGKVHLPEGSFTAGPHAHITAEIEAREIIVRGEVVGTLKARERVHVSSTGRLIGDMDTRGIVIEDGAILHSNVANPRTVPVLGEARKAVAPKAVSAEAAAASAEPLSKETQQSSPVVNESPRSKGAAAGDS